MIGLRLVDRRNDMTLILRWVRRIDQEATILFGIRLSADRIGARREKIVGINALGPQRILSANRRRNSVDMR